MKGCLKNKSRSPSPGCGDCSRKCVAFEPKQEVHIADEWDRTPTEPTRALTYQDILELKEIQNSLPHADQPADPVTGRPAKHILSAVPITLVPLLNGNSSPTTTSTTTTTTTTTTSPWTMSMSFSQPKPRLPIAFLPLLDTPPSSGTSSPLLNIWSPSASPPPIEPCDPPTPSLTNASLDSSPHSSPQHLRSFLPLPPPNLTDSYFSLPPPPPPKKKKEKKRNFIVVNGIEMEWDDDEEGDDDDDEEESVLPTADTALSDRVPLALQPPPPPRTPTFVPPCSTEARDQSNLDEGAMQFTAEVLPDSSILALSSVSLSAEETKPAHTPTPIQSSADLTSTPTSHLPSPPPSPKPANPSLSASSSLSGGLSSRFSATTSEPSSNGNVNLHIPVLFKRGIVQKMNSQPRMPVAVGVGVRVGRGWTN